MAGHASYIGFMQQTSVRMACTESHCLHKFWLNVRRRHCEAGTYVAVQRCSAHVVGRSSGAASQYSA